jgi:hypothetical protein
MMKIVKILSILGLCVVLFFLFELMASAQPVPVAKPPTITHAFAADKGSYHHGYIWKIYIEAEAGDANMSRIALAMDQPGAGSYPTDWIIVKPQYQTHMKGYIQWNARSVGGDLNEGTMITLRVSIFDKAGKESNVAVFHFTFESGIKDSNKYKLPPPFDQGDLPRLGYINIELHPVGGGPE